MGTKDDKFGVLLYDEAWEVLSSALKPYEQNGPIGRYLYCKKFDVVGLFATLTFTPEQVNNRIKDEMSIWIPASFIKFVATATDANAKAMGFIQ